ncbi:FadR/GntR family transcriptional regulator [soil metagenome]
MPLKSARDTSGNPSVEAVLARPRSRGLAHGIVEDLSGQIRAQTLCPGVRLPTEAELVQAYGVSRTVVREAISSLQASGLVETLHGVGTFVLQPRMASMFRLDASQIATSIDVLAVLELRISLETGAAALAAVSRSAAQLAGMRDSLDRFMQSVARSGDGVSDDFQFHLQIAEATGNPYFKDIMVHIGTALIPRNRIDAVRNDELRTEYLGRVNREHEEIYAAIARGDADSARAAMRIHLTNSRERLRQAQHAATLLNRKTDV